MTDSAEDKSQWTEGRLQEEILKLMPVSCFLASEPVDGGYQVSIIKENFSAKGERLEEPLWSFTHPVKRWALFEAYGYLWLPQHKPSSMWSPDRASRDAITRDAVTKYAISKEADPGDLDPNEIAAVYEKTKSK
jgi:hypothetical protein